MHPGWQMQKVVRRTGVESRHWSAPDETALDLGEAACRELQRRGVDLSRVGAVLFCTQTPDHVMPPNACLLQYRLGLPSQVAALDFSLACSGFVYGLYLARSLIISNTTEQVLLVTAETYSKIMNPDDRGPATLFGDGGAATLISAGRDAIGPVTVATDSEGAAHLMVKAGGARVPRSSSTCVPERDKNGNYRSAEQLYMNGAAIVDFVKKEVPSVIESVLRDAKLTLDDVDLVVFHQASKLTLDFLHEHLGIPPEKQYLNLERIGNTVSASIPLALEEAERVGRLRPGMRVLVVGFGVGLSWGGCLIDW